MENVESFQGNWKFIEEKRNLLACALGYFPCEWFHKKSIIYEEN